MMTSFESIRVGVGKGGVRSARPGWCTGLVLGAALLGAACLTGCGGGDDDDGGDGGGDDGGNEVSFSADIQPIFDAKCVHCHHENSATLIDLTDAFGPEGIIDRPNSYVPNGSPFEVLVDPGVPDNSFILRKVSGDALDPDLEGKSMPFETPYLDGDQLNAVRDWISAGAPDNDPLFDAVEEIFGTDDTSVGAAAGKCTFCHPGPQTRMDIIGVFDPTNGLVDVSAQLGGTRVIPGDPDNSVLVQKLEGQEDVGDQMPFNPEPMTAGEVADLTAWIEAGAPNN